MDKRIYPHPIIAREGWVFIAVSGILALIATAMDWDFASFILWVLFVVVVQFFRDPAREISGGEKDVLSVVDGQVLKVEKRIDPYTGRDALLISVFMNVFNVHSQKSPVKGEVLKKVYRAGQFFNASLDKASEENEQCATVIRTEDGNIVTAVQIAGLITHRILNYAEKGKLLERGERYGFIRFGSRVDLYLPLTAQPKVVIGEKVWAPTSVLAVLGEATEEDKAFAAAGEKPVESAAPATELSPAAAAADKAEEEPAEDPDEAEEAEDSSSEPVKEEVLDESAAEEPEVPAAGGSGAEPQEGGDGESESPEPGESKKD